MPALTQLSVALSDRDSSQVSGRQDFDIYLEKISFVFVTVESFCEILHFSK